MKFYSILLIIISSLLFINCNEEEKGPLNGFYTGILEADVEVLNITYYGDTLRSTFFKMEEFSVNLRGDRYYSQSRNGDIIVINDNSVEFDLQSDNCPMFCEATLNGRMDYSIVNDTLYLEDVFSRQQTYFYQQWTIEDRRFRLVRK